MRRLKYFMSGILLLILAAAVGSAQVKTPTSNPEVQAGPTMEEVAVPAAEAPAEPSAASVAAQPSSLVYVGPEGSFLLHPGRSRGIFRWSGTHWANSISFVFEDANYWMYRLDGTNGWFGFAKNPSGGTYIVWKGLGAASNSITWQDTPNGWMRASRNTASGNLN